MVARAAMVVRATFWVGGVGRKKRNRKSIVHLLLIYIESVILPGLRGIRQNPLFLSKHF